MWGRGMRDGGTHGLQMRAAGCVGMAWGMGGCVAWPADEDGRVSVWHKDVQAAWRMSTWWQATPPHQVYAGKRSMVASGPPPRHGPAQSSTHSYVYCPGQSASHPPCHSMLSQLPSSALSVSQSWIMSGCCPPCGHSPSPTDLTHWSHAAHNSDHVTSRHVAHRERSGSSVYTQCFMLPTNPLPKTGSGCRMCLGK